jgi:hypothetical protein
MATQFIVHGPFRVPFTRASAAKFIKTSDGRSFWDWYPDLAKERGCYVFAMANRGLTPGYVGRATKSFRQEVFTPDKLHKYGQFLADYRRGRPVMFLVVAPRKAGKPNSSHIEELEDFLIQVALTANSALLNVRGTKQEQWSIAGVLRSGKGKPSKAARRLRQSLKI